MLFMATYFYFVQDTVYADNLTAIVVHAAEFSYVEGEDYYNFSVRLCGCLVCVCVCSVG